jgi:predicted lactoylglutathione lyase
MHAQSAGGMPAHLSMVVLGARDLPALRSYYRALGWPERAGGSDRLSTFDLDSVELTLYPHSEPHRPEEAVLADRSAVTLVVRVDTPSEVDTACSAAQTAGGHLVVDPQDHPWGGRSGIVADPEGNRWEVLWVSRSAPKGATVD